MARKHPAREKRPAPETRAPAEDRIRARAFEIWIRNGCRDGCDVEDWLQAQEELRAETAPAASATGAAA